MGMPTPPDSLDELLSRGKNLRACGLPASALPFFLRTSYLNPDNNEVQQELQETRDDIRRLHTIITKCEDQVAVHRWDARSWLEMGNALKRLERNEEALESYSQALAQDPDEELTWELLFAKGNLLNNCSRYKEALKVFDQLITHSPDCAAGYAFKAMVLCNIGRYDEALPLTDQAIALDQNDIGAWFNKVKALYALGRFEEAQEAHRHENAARRASGVAAWMPRDEDEDEDEDVGEK